MYSQDADAKPPNAPYLDSSSTRVNTQVHTYTRKPPNICTETTARDCHDIFAGNLWQDMKRDKHEESNNERGDKEDWQFFSPFCVEERKKVFREYVCVGICIIVCQRPLYAC